MDTVELRNFIDKNKPFKEAEGGFWNWINNWQADDPEDYFEAFGDEDISAIELKQRRIALVISYQFDSPYEFVQTTLNVVFKESCIAQYHYLQDFRGNVIDDSLSFEKYSILTVKD